jgi:hypothetical protein
MLKVLAICAAVLPVAVTAQAQSLPITEDALHELLVPEGLTANWKYGTDGKLAWVTDVEISGGGFLFEARRISVAPSHSGNFHPFQAEYLLFREQGDDGMTSQKDVRISGLAGVDVAGISSLMDGRWCHPDGQPLAEAPMSFIDLTIAPGIGQQDAARYRLPGMVLTPVGDQDCARAFTVSAPNVEVDENRVKVNPDVTVTGPILQWQVETD